MDTATDTETAEALVEIRVGIIPADLWSKLSRPPRDAGAVSRALLGLAELPEAVDLVRAGIAESAGMGPTIRPGLYRPFVPPAVRDALDKLTARLAMVSRAATAVALLAAWATDIDAGIDAAAALAEGRTEEASAAVGRRLAVLREKAEEPGS